MGIFEINPDIARAETLSSEFYTDEKYFYESKEKIFARSWQLAATVDDAPNLTPLNLLENFLDEPLLLTRDGKKFNCLSNVCTHRGKILVEKKCRAGGLRCGYHGRRFDLGGRFLSMPEFEGVQNFPSEKDDLCKVPFEIWENLAFVSLAPRAPFEDFFGRMRELTHSLYAEKWRLASTKDYFVNAHWALYCENYLEGFHIPFVHQGLNQAIDYGTYRTELFRFANVQIALSEDAGACFDGNVAAYYFFVFPNLMLNFYPWGVSVNVVKPLKPDRTQISYLTLVADESKLNRGAGSELETVEFEDQAVVEAVQKGIRSRFYERGRYAPTREQGTHHFHRLIAEFMGQ